MKTLAICLLVLVATANATSLFEKYPINWSSKRSIMTLMTQIESKLKTGGPMDAITKALDEFQATITKEQSTHDALFNKQTEECESEFAFREREVADAEGALKEATETLDGCTTQHQRAEGDFAITKKQVGENRNYLAVLEETRKREAYMFETQTTVYQMTTEAVAEALDILEKIFTGEAVLIDLVKHTNGMLKNTVKLRKSHMLAPIMSALVQLATADEGDTKLFEKVRDLITNFGKKVQDDYFAASESEEAAIALYNEDKARLEETIAHLEDQMNSLQNEIQELQKCIVTQQGIVSASTAKRDRNQTLLDDAHALCGAVTVEYENATKARKEELKLLDMIRERVEARFAQMGETVVENMTD